MNFAQGTNSIGCNYSGVTMATLLTGDVIANWLDEHLPYELSMLRYSFRRMQAAAEPFDYNAHYECFVVKARLFWLFLANKEEKGNVQASDFELAFRAPDRQHIQAALNKLNSQVLHTGEARPTEASGKVNLSDCRRIVEWAESGMDGFLEALTPERRALWNSAKAREDLRVTMGFYGNTPVHVTRDGPSTSTSGIAITSSTAATMSAGSAVRSAYVKLPRGSGPREA